MAFDPVIQWARIVAAMNERDWATCEALVADDFNFVVFLGDLYGAIPTVQFDKVGFMRHGRSLAKRGWQHRSKSMAGLGDTAVTTAEETFDDGSSQLEYAVVRFNDQGQAVQMYATSPALPGA